MKKLILIIEDEQKNLKLLRDLLQVSGYSTSEAANGKQGIELARQKRPDLIVMDIHLPVMDGITAINILKQDTDTQDIPILVISAFAMDRDKERAVQAGCDGYLSKPIDIRDFLRKVREHL